MIVRGLVGSTLVLAGGLVTSALPWSTPLASAPVLQPLRASPTGRMLATVVVASGLVVLGSAWLRLLARTGPAAGTDPGEGIRLVRTAACVWSLPLLVAPPLFSRDAWSYAAQGELTHLGLSPYVWTPSILDGQIREAVDPLWLHTLTPYGPLPLAWGSFLAGLTDNPWLLVIGHRLLAVVGLALLAWAVPRLATRGGQDPVRASALVLACPLTVVHGIGGAHNDLVMAGLMATALVVAFERSWVLAAVLGGAAAAVKLPGGLVCVGVALASLPVLATAGARLRRLAATGCVAVLVVVGLGVWLGVGVGWVHALGTPGAVRTPMSASTQLGAALASLGVPRAIDILRALGLLLAGGTVAWVAWRGRTGRPAAVIGSTALTTASLVALSPAVHAWYALWCLPFLAACAWGRTADAALRDLLLVLGVVPMESSWHGVSVALVAVLGLIVLVAVRRRVTGRAGWIQAQATAARGRVTLR